VPRGTPGRSTLAGDVCTEKLDEGGCTDPSKGTFAELGQARVFGQMWTRYGLEPKKRSGSWRQTSSERRAERTA